MRIATLALLSLVIACAEFSSIEEGAETYSPDVQATLCLQQTVLISEALEGVDRLVSEISASDCDRAVDGEQGYFETWQIFADEAAEVVIDVDSGFDSIIELYRVTGNSDVDGPTTILIASNDDRAFDDPGARVVASLGKAENYLVRVAGFGDDELGNYTLRVSSEGTSWDPPETGTLEIEVISEGEPAGYRVTVNDDKAREVSADGTATYSALVTGAYVVELGDLLTCEVDGAVTQTVDVVANQSRTVTFRVSCPEPVGAIRITTVTTGVDLDDTYSILIDEEQVSAGVVPPNSDYLVTDLPEGMYSVSLGDIADNCSWVSASVFNVLVRGSATFDLTFELECVSTVAPQVSLVTVEKVAVGGCAPPSESYRYRVDFVDPNGDITVAESVVEVLYVWSNGDNAGYTSEPSFHSIEGNGFGGTFKVIACLGFPLFTFYVDATFTLVDAAGNASNPFTERVPAPPP